MCAYRTFSSIRSFHSCRRSCRARSRGGHHHIRGARPVQEASPCRLGQGQGREACPHLLVEEVASTTEPDQDVRLLLGTSSSLDTFLKLQEGGKVGLDLVEAWSRIRSRNVLARHFTDMISQMARGNRERDRDKPRQHQDGGRGCNSLWPKQTQPGQKPVRYSMALAIISKRRSFLT